MAQDTMRPEARAIWVVRYDMTSPESIRKVVDTAKANNFNTLIVQVRGRGDAFYNGGKEPRAESLAGQPAEFDPLQTAIDLGHAAGLQVHAWLNTFYTWSGSRKPKDPAHVVNAHPEWLMSNRDGVVDFTSGATSEGAFMDPGNPEARKWIHDVFLDVATRYDVDGIHFDYVRYPNKDTGFNDGDLKQFQDLVDAGLTPEQKEALSAEPRRDAYTLMFPNRWAQWRRDNVTALVRSIYEDVKKVKPDIAVSAALIPWGTFTTWEDSDAYNTVSQEWFRWMREGILDIAVPMTYHKDEGQWASWVQAAVANRHKTHVWAGVGDWLEDGPGDAAKVKLGRQLGVQGISFFAWNSITASGPSSDSAGENAPRDGQPKIEYLRENVYQNPAPVPDFRAPQPDAKPSKVVIPPPSPTEQPRW